MRNAKWHKKAKIIGSQVIMSLPVEAETIIEIEYTVAYAPRIVENLTKPVFSDTINVKGKN